MSLRKRIESLEQRQRGFEDGLASRPKPRIRLEGETGDYDRGYDRGLYANLTIRGKKRVITEEDAA